MTETRLYQTCWLYIQYLYFPVMKKFCLNTENLKIHKARLQKLKLQLEKNWGAWNRTGQPRRVKVKSRKPASLIPVGQSKCCVEVMKTQPGRKHASREAQWSRQVQESAVKRHWLASCLWGSTEGPGDPWPRGQASTASPLEESS